MQLSPDMSSGSSRTVLSGTPHISPVRLLGNPCRLAVSGELRCFLLPGIDIALQVLGLAGGQRRLDIASGRPQYSP